MDLNELKQKLDSISSELKSKVPKEAQILVESQTVLLEILLSQNERLNETLKDLQETIKELRRQLGQNSKNSSKPPSTDGYKKPRSLRKKSDLKAGGEPIWSSRTSLTRSENICLKNVRLALIWPNAWHQNMYSHVTPPAMWLNL